MIRKSKELGTIQSAVLLYLLLFIILLSCNTQENATEIMQKAIKTIDNIETLSFKQDMWRSDPSNSTDSIFRYREMIFKRLRSDSIVGVKGHWYMYVNDKKNIIYEDIYDGNKLIRKNNRDSIARIYDLLKNPAFKQEHFWSHQSPFGIQYTFKYILKNKDAYHLSRSNDTLINGKACFQIKTSLVNQISMPGFMTQLEGQEGNFSRNIYVIDQENFYPVRIKGENYTNDQPGQRIFIEQKYYDIVFNPELDEAVVFNTSVEAIKGFKIVEMTPE